MSENKLTDTNMMVEFLANSEKIKAPNDRWYYNGHDTTEKEDDAKNDLDDVMDSYKKPERTERPERVEKMESKKVDFAERATESRKPSSQPEEETWTKDKLLIEKQKMLIKLGELKQAGIPLSQNYSLNSDYSTMKMEYDLRTRVKSKSNAIQWMSSVLYAIVSGVEIANDTYNPFDLKFNKQWSASVSNDIKNYYEVLGDLYDKYTSDKKMSPECKLVVMLLCSAVSIQMQNGIRTMIPKMSGSLNDDVINKLNTERANEVLQKNATEVMNNMNSIKKSENDYRYMQQMAADDKLSALKKNLVMSDTSRSMGMSDIAPHVAPHIIQQQMQQPIQQSQQPILFEQQENLRKTQQLLEQMRNMQLTQQSTVPTQQQMAPTQQNTVFTPPQRNNQQDNEQTESFASTASTVSVNPNIKNILGQLPTNEINPDMISVGSKSVDSDKGRKNEIKTGKKK